MRNIDTYYLNLPFAIVCTIMMVLMLSIGSWGLALISGLAAVANLAITSVDKGWF